MFRRALCSSHGICGILFFSLSRYHLAGWYTVEMLCSSNLNLIIKLFQTVLSEYGLNALFFTVNPPGFVIAITIPIPIPMQTVHQMCIIGKFALSVVTCQPFNIMWERRFWWDCFIHLLLFSWKRDTSDYRVPIDGIRRMSNKYFRIDKKFNIDKSIRFCIFFL